MKNKTATILKILMIPLVIGSFYTIAAIVKEDQSTSIGEEDFITVPDDYITIQDAINHANPGVSIYVKRGVYEESIIIDTERITLQGEDKNNTIIRGGSGTDLITICANFTTISGFTIKNSNGWSGITILRSNKNIVDGNIIRNCSQSGVRLYESSGNIIQNNIIDNTSP